MPKRIQLSRQKGWRKPAGAVVVSRPSKWGNPFSGWDALVAFKRWLGGSHIVDIVFRYNVRVRIVPKRYGPDVLAAAREEIIGKDLCCWCRLCQRHKDGKPLDEECPDCQPCHVDVYGRLLYRGEP